MISCLFLVALLLSCATAQYSGPVFLGNYQTEILDTHNALRARACVPPLRWNPYLALVADNYAKRCIMQHNDARTTDFENVLRTYGQVVPPSDIARYPDCSAVGENIAQSSMI